MKAIQIHQYGGPDVLKLEEVADPVAKDGELLVRVRAAGVNPVDTYVRTGTYAIKPTLPYIPGGELAGEIASGPRKGERIFSHGTVGQRLTGASAEFAVVREQDAYHLPDHLSFAQGAAIPVAFGTAWRALFDRGHLVAGQTVLVHGASGGVGTAAVQIASAYGATVIGTASTPAGAEVVRTSGASHVFNHKYATYRDQIKAVTDHKGVDLIIEMLANVNLDHDLDLLALGGSVVVIGSRGRIEIDPRKTMVKESTITGVTFWGGGEVALRRAFAGISALLERGVLKPIVAAEFPLHEVAKAHAAVMQDGSTGKIVLAI